MDTNQDAVMKDLKTLKLEDKDIEELSIRDVIKAYRNLVRKVHPDVSGYESNADFQDLGNAYERILRAVVDMTKKRETDSEKTTDDEANSCDDDEEKFVKENFHNFNFPADKDGHFVVVVQNELADLWADCFEKNHGAPRINSRAGKEVSRLWKICYKETNLTIHFYNKPKTTKISKFLVQGGNQVVKQLFVFDELPTIYKSVCAQKPKLEMKKAERVPYKCNQCKVTATTLADLRKHTKTKHNKLSETIVKVHETIDQTRKSIKRLPMFTPIAKSFKKSKHEQPIAILDTVNEEAIVSKKILNENLSILDMSINENSKLVTLDESTNSTDSCEKVQEDLAEIQEVINEEIRNSANYYCTKCRESFQYEKQLDEHVEQAHEADAHMKSQIENLQCCCNFCTKKFSTENELGWHLETEHARSLTPNNCPESEVIFTNQQNMDNHTITEHGEDTDEHVWSYICEECGQRFKDTKMLEEHIAYKHRTQEPLPCDVCGLVLANIQLLQTHVTNIHVPAPTQIKCQYCEKTAGNEDSLRTHINDEHVDYVILHKMAKQVDSIHDKLEDFDKMKEILGQTLQSLQTIVSNQNEMKQELFLLRNIEAGRTKDKQSVWPPSSTPSSTPPGSPTVSIPTSRTQSTRTLKPDYVVNKEKEKEKTRKPTKILYVGDSISTNVNVKALEEATEAKFVASKAYSAIYDIEENKAKKASEYPRSNFTDVIPAELKKDDFKTIVLQASSEDITNLNTKDEPEKYIEYFKQVSIMAAQNLFSAAERALEDENNVEKVVIMKQTPRYDPVDVDPLTLKPALADLYNKTLTDCWMNSRLSKKIFVGAHNIECSGAIREARYRHTMSGRYDGVHLYGSSGKKAYTLSVLNILKSAKLTTSDYDYHQNCNQSKFQRVTRYRVNGKQNYVKWTIPQSHPVPTSNRFSSLRGVQGNW